MLKPIFIACVAAFGTFAIIVGCDAPSTTGTSPRAGSSGDDDDDTTKKKTTSSSSSGGTEVQADCTNLPPASDTKACDDCTKAKCCSAYAKCMASDACKEQADCVAKATDAFSALACSLDEDPDFGALGSCAKSKCSDVCKAADLDGGLDDPFGDF